MLKQNLEVTKQTDKCFGKKGERENVRTMKKYQHSQQDVVKGDCRPPLDCNGWWVRWVGCQYAVFEGFG